MSLSPEGHIGSFVAPLHLKLGEGEVSPRRLDLLAAVRQCGSINAAAKQVGMTYKAAWDAVEAMNNLAGQPLVVARHGGRGGGGAELTAAGTWIVEAHERLKCLQEAFMAQLQGDDDIHTALDLLRRLEMKTSARNALHGTIEEVREGAVNSEVTLRLAGDDCLHAIVTRESAHEMGLAAGMPAWALIKASWVILAAPEECVKVSARNRLCGTIKRIQEGAVNAEVVVELAGGTTLAAIITEVSLESLGYKVGDTVCALIKSSHVILGVD